MKIFALLLAISCAFAPRAGAAEDFFAALRPRLEPYRAIERGDLAAARARWSAAESQGLLSARERFNLAQLLRRGWGGPPDASGAALLLFRASLHGVLPAVHNYALTVRAGRGAFPGIEAPAEALLERAARAGYAPSRQALEALAEGREPEWVEGFVNLDGDAWSPAPGLAPASVGNRAACAAESRRPARSVLVLIDGYNAGKLAHSLAKARGQDAGAAAARGMESFREGVGRLATRVWEELLGGSEIRCHELHRFSPAFQASLSRLPAARDRRAWLESLAVAEKASLEFAVPCGWPSQRGGGRFSVLQLELVGGKAARESLWAKEGFALWERFFSEFPSRWREDPGAVAAPEELSRAFQSLAIEEAVLWVPQGCASTRRPGCDALELGARTLRELLIPGPLPDVLRALPRGTQDGLLGDGSGAALGEGVENGGAAPGVPTQDWWKGFEERLQRARGDLRGRERRARATLASVRDGHRAERVSETMERAGRGEFRRAEAYALCSEWTLALHPRWGWLRRDLERLISLGRSEDGPDSVLEADWKRFSEVSDRVNSSCALWEARKDWDSLDPLQVAGVPFADWYRDLLPELHKQAEAPAGKTRLSLSASPLEALRAELEAWVELRSVSLYRELLLGGDRFTSPSIFNPLAAPTACGIYDPNFRKRAALKDLWIGLGSMGLAASFGVPAMVVSRTIPARVDSLESLVRDGRLVFRSVGQGERTELSLWSAFAPVRNLQCVLSLGDLPAASIPPGSIWSGLNLSGCRQRGGESIESSSPENWVRAVDGSAECVTCSIRFLPSAGWTRPSVSPWGAMGVAGVQFLRALSDPQEIPRYGRVDWRALRETYERHGGTIPESCVGDLMLGRPCARDACARELESEVSRRIRLPVWAELPNDSSGTARIRLRESPSWSWEEALHAGCGSGESP